jgi:chromosome segregation ATPase
MDLAEVRNLVKWIDEQQRKGRQDLATLQQRFANQEQEVSGMAERINKLEGELASARIEITRLSQVDEMMDQLKAEIVHLIEQADDRRIQSEKEMERLRQVEHSAHTRSLTEVKEQLVPVPRLVEAMEQRRAEEERLSAAIATLQNEIPAIQARLDERIRDVAYLEQNQSKDSRRISELQQSSNEHQKRADQLQAKHLMLEDLMRRNESRLENLQKSETERRQTLDRFLEQGRLADQRRKQDMARWDEKLEEYEELMAGYARQWRQFDEQHRLSRESTAGLEELKHRLEQRQNEMSELQRVDTERLKQQWVEFLADVDRRRKQRQIEQEQWLNEQKRHRDEEIEQYQAMQEQLDKVAADIKALYELQMKYADAFRQFARIWLEGYESIVSPPVTRRIPG